MANKLLIIISFAFFFFVFPTEAQAVTVNINPAQTIQTILNSINPGDTVIIGDGVYHQTLNINRSGTSQAPITFRAQTDGKAIFDGENIRPPVIISGNYINLEGIVAANSNDQGISISGNNITVKRTSSYHARADQNRHAWIISGSNVTLEDCVGAGTGRYMFLNYSGSNTSRGFVCRRCFARWYDRDDKSSTGESPRFGFGIYGATEATLENVVSTHAIPTRLSDNQIVHGGVVTTYTAGEPGHVAPSNVKVRGSVFFNNFNFGAWIINGGDNISFENVLFMDNKNTNAIRSPAGFACAQPTNCSVYRSTFVNNNIGVRAWWGSESTLKLENNLFINNQYVASQNTPHRFLNYWQNQSMGSLSIDTTDKQVDPKLSTDIYGRGGYLFIPNASPLKNAGINNSDIGANIIYRYQNGQLTNEPLWPWPMDDRIQRETEQYLGQKISVTWEQYEGLWKTLAGIYLMSPSPSPTSSPHKQGDANGDGRVDGVDYIVWLNNLNKNIFGAINGDFNNSGKVDGVDYVVWLNGYGK